MAFLADSGTLTYNSVSIANLVKTKISGTPIYDGANRVTKYVQWKLTVRGWVNGGSQEPGTTDVQWGNLRKALTKPGRPLIYENKGFDSLRVNVPGEEVRDAAWGPHPKLLEFTPIGDSKTTLVEWQCVTQIPECNDAVYQKEFAEVNYEQTFDTDVDGYTTIRTAIDAEIAMTQINGLTGVPDHIDAYLERITPPVPLGYKRETSRTLSKDKRTVRLNITDTPMPSAFPNFVTSISLKHSVRTNVLTNGAKWFCKLSGNITLAADQPKSLAFNVFLNVAATKLGAPLSLAARPLPPEIPTLALVARVFQTILGELEITDDVYGKGTDFSLSWQSLGVGDLSLRDAITATGLWHVDGNTNFAKWRRSVELAHRPIGVRGVRAKANDDIILDLCRPYREPAPAAPSPSITTGRAVVPTSGARGVRGSDLDPERTWLSFTADVQRSEENFIARHHPVGGTVQELPMLVEADDTAQRVGQDRTANGQIQTPSDTPDVVGNVPEVLQRVAQPSITLRLTGSAVRIGYKIDPPGLASVGGLPVTQMRRWDSGNMIVGGAGGVPIYAMAWDITYAVPSVPNTIPTPANPYLKIDGAA